MLKYKDGIIRITEDATIITKDCSPKFNGWTYAMYQADPYIRFLEVMTAKECDKEDIPEDGTIAEIKYDGHRASCSITLQGNRFFSRRISKKTGWYSENTDCLPHLRDYDLGEFTGTILDGEITMPTGVFADVQGVTGALPETALQNQIEKGFAIYNAFDIIYYKGINIRSMPLWKRKLYLFNVLRENKNPCIKFAPFFATKETHAKFLELKEGYSEGKWYFDPIPEIVKSFRKLLEEMWEQGLEGLIIKSIYGKYEYKRSKNSLKLKGEITRDVVIMGFEPPTMYYDGNAFEEEDGTWDYWVDCDDPCPFEKTMTDAEAKERNCAPVTKPYANGWIGAIVCGVYRDGKLFKVAEAKGITDADQVFILANKSKLVGEQVIEIKAQEIINKETGTLRHPRFNRWRNDKNKESCTWKNYLGEE